MQSSEYVLCPDFITTYRKVDLSEANSLWSIIHQPSKTTIDIILQIVFHGRSYGPKVVPRYYLAGAVDDNSSAYYDRIDKSGLNMASNLVNHMRENKVTRQRQNLDNTIGNSTDQEYIPLPGDLLPLFSIDTVGDPTQVHEDLVCPLTIGDMMLIVRTLRDKRSQLMANTQVNFITPTKSKKLPSFSSINDY